MGIQLMIIASIFIAVSNYCMRRSIDSGGSSKAFLMIQLSLVCLVAILLNPVRTGIYGWSHCMAIFGIAAGIILGTMVIFLGKALETGPPGLTFAILNASTVMPMILMVIFFGASFGYVYTLSHAAGSLVVIIGLLWAAWQAIRSQKQVQWGALIMGAFLLHVLFLVVMQWRALFINFPGANGLYLSFDMEDSTCCQWFMPILFFVAALIQIGYYLATQKRVPNRSEVLYGVLGGVVNGIGTFFMIWSTEVSTSLEHAMIFPIFAVTIIIGCNLWGQWIYKEKVNWAANICCIVGIFIGSLDWKALLG